MGITATELNYWACLRNSVGITDWRTICDLGQQDIHRTSSDGFAISSRHFAELIGRPDVDLSNCRSSAEMWKALGREIVSLDIVGSGDDFRRFDLNIDSVPRHMRGNFDLVTNFGTTEHVANQLNAFRAIHDLTKIGGIMLHVVPAAGHSNHGLINYNMKFFFALCRANGYEVIDAMIDVNEAADAALDVDVRAFAEQFRKAGFSDRKRIDSFVSKDSAIRICLRRRSRRSFSTPLDVPSLKIVRRSSLWQRLLSRSRQKAPYLQRY